ncbi:anti-sigma factor domain-containing protein [Bacillus sp. ISL-40]|uniref:anti-sigma factor domain-containing protein n=1 Tax=unclassified Bacillus (in: firmicutes) TaxID=185979 RepID=UPI001BE6ADD4|nr:MULTISPECIES: anti-sigma factor domain-containing protein [unclassified Bacillus (in: firmicutes)]MBT2697000.1 anti-sigma factor domain-containing protein [Bacillus sp. ISL-40]MBT2741448.1 anti-sigma factor domain-containing protein [Bacillus sp. ISL-77]
MKKGVVMEIDDAFLTLLTPEGEFLHAKRQNQPYAIGEEIHFFPIESGKTSNHLNTLKNVFKLKPVWALMAALFIFLGSFFPMYQNNKAYAYMSIDVNPSIELSINKKMQVVEITGYNKEGKEIISQLNKWEKEDVSKVAQTILAEMKKEGYLNTKENIIISTVRTKEAEGKIDKKLQENIDEIKASVNKQKLEITVLKATESEWKKAHKLGITTGKYKKNKVQGSINQNMKTKDKGGKIESKAVPLSPPNKFPPGQVKKQVENKAVQNKGIAENKKQIEKKWVNGKLTAPGQLKRIEEDQRKQKPPQQKKQNNQREKSSENKNSKINEKHKEKDNQKVDGKNIGQHQVKYTPKYKDKK